MNGDRSSFRLPPSSFVKHGFDDLEFDRYTEFHLLSRELAETTSDVQTVAGELGHLIGDFDSYLNRQARLASELEDRLMGLRMVPLSNLATRLHRTVRTAAAQLGKAAELVLEGENTGLDKTVLEEMADPLLHLLRNAVDHGIEPADLRQAQGKPARGQIRLRACHEGNQVVLQISDDGAGINLERVRAVAVQRGFVSSSDAGQLAEEDLYALLFRPGFSTAAEVSEISGRGVGLDVVRARIHKLKGTLVLDSRPGQGTTFTVRLPLTLAITRALLVKARQETFALPLDAVRQILRVEQADIEKVGQEPVLRIDGQAYPVVFLDRALNLPQAAEDRVRRPPVLLLGAGGKQVALVVDGLLGGREIVVKSLGSHLRHVHGVTGATLLGDGRVVLILNPAELLREPPARVAVRPQAPAAPLRTADSLTVLVVDDSPSVRRVVSNLIKSVGWKPLTARDGLEALELLHRSADRPDLVLLDIEMPRMDGYELLAALQAEEAWRPIPVVILTSRAGEKHRRKALDLGAAGYVSKPYQDEALLNVIRHLVREARQAVLA
jgi:chemosensory pili system protein ChpA (sensor histidine kinase/response regulator)